MIEMPTLHRRRAGAPPRRRPAPDSDRDRRRRKRADRMQWAGRAANWL